MKKRINSRARGARGEREWRDVLRNAGFTARRGQQFSGGSDSPDVICDEMADKFHPEVKRVQRLNIVDAMNQAIGEAGDKVPYVAHRRNHCEWLVTMRADDFLNMAREVI